MFICILAPYYRWWINYIRIGIFTAVAVAGILAIVEAGQAETFDDPYDPNSGSTGTLIALVCIVPAAIGGFLCAMLFFKVSLRRLYRYILN